MADLTSLAAVKQFLVIKSDGVDQLIPRLITRESRHIERWTSRIFPFVQRTDKRLDGTGSSMLMLPDSPIIAVQSLSIDGTPITAANASGAAGPGYSFDDSTLYLQGGARFPMGRQNVMCSWSAGYQANVAATIPEGNTPALWLMDPGTPAIVNAVTKADGTAMTLTTSANGPVAGEYAFVAPNLLFSTDDADTDIFVDAYYIPPPVEEACIEMVGLDLKQRDNLGIKSKTMANETISYENGGMTLSVKEQLQPFRKVAPV